MEPVHTAYDVVQAEIDRGTAKTPERQQNKLSLFKTRYRQRLENEFGAYMDPFTVGKNAALRSIMNRLGEDHMLAALDWFFDNWPTLKVAEADFFANDDFPPLRVLLSTDMMTRWEPLVRTGKPATVAPLSPWHGSVTQRGKELDQFQEEHGNLLADIEL